MTRIYYSLTTLFVVSICFVSCKKEDKGKWVDNPSCDISHSRLVEKLAEDKYGIKTTTNQYDELGRLIEDRYTAAGTSSNTSRKYSYVSDDLVNLTGEGYYAEGDKLQGSFFFDAQGHQVRSIICTIRPGGDTVRIEHYHYIYNVSGEMIQSTQFELQAADGFQSPVDADTNHYTWEGGNIVWSSEKLVGETEYEFIEGSDGRMMGNIPWQACRWLYFTPSTAKINRNIIRRTIQTNKNNNSQTIEDMYETHFDSHGRLNNSKSRITNSSESYESTTTYRYTCI
jgi:hypothetical protein